MALARIIVLSVLVHFGFVAARMTGALYALANNASAFTVGVLIALFALVPMLIAVRAGRWLDAVGPWRPLAAGVALMLGGTCLPALFPYVVADIAPLLVGSCLIGTGSMLVQLTVQNLVGHLAQPGRRPEAFSWLALGASSASFTAPIVSGVLIDHYGHRVAFAAMFVFALAALAVLLAQRSALRARGGQPESTAATPLFDLFRVKAIRNVLIAGALVSMAWDLHTFMVPIYGTRIGLSASQIGLVLGSFAAATFGIRLAMPRLSRTFTEWQVLTFTLYTAAAAFALMPLLDELLPLIAATFLLGLGLGAAQPNVMSLLHADAPPGRVGEALGVRTTLMNGSHVALPLLLGAAGSLLGPALVFWAMALLFASGATAARRIARRVAPDLVRR